MCWHRLFRTLCFPKCNLIYNLKVEENVNGTIMLLIKLFRIGPVTGPSLAVLDRGRRPRSNTADREPVTGPIRNNLINEILIN